MQSVEFNINESREYRLDQAILLYRHSKVGRYPLVAATVHPVEFKDSVPVIQPGRPLDLAALKHLAEHFDTPEEYDRTQFLPEGIVAIGPRKLVWRVPGGWYPLRWKTRNDQLDKYDKKPVNLPPLLFMTTGETLRVFAMRDYGRPTPKTELFQPPFFNCADNGQVCMPNHEPVGCKAAAAERWNELFFDSPFTHSSSATVSSGTINEFWTEYLASGAYSFPLDRLKPANLTVGELCK